MSLEENKVYKFGKITLDNRQIFYERKLVFAFVNIRPFMKGHVLLSPVRVEKKFENLTETEAMEMWISAKLIGENMKKYYQCTSVQYVIQNGEDAGQTVPHCHMHIIPIPPGYKSKGLEGATKVNRTIEDMGKEADEYKQKFVFP